MSIRARATRALTWSWIQAGAGAVLQLATTAVLARLLVPDDFGLVALATVFIRFLTYFSQLGFAVAIVQREHVHPDELSQLATLSVAVGAGFTLLGFGLSLLASGDVGVVVRGLSLTLVLQGLAAVPSGYLRRELRNKELAMAELAGTLVGNAAVSIVLAALGAGAWAIVAGLLVHQIVVALATWRWARAGGMPIGFSLPTRACRAYLGYGVRHSWNTFLEFVFYNVEVLVIGRWFGVQSTGYYNRSYSLSHLAVEQVIASVVRVLFPLLSRVRGDAEKERQAFGAALLCGGLFASGFCAAMFVSAPEITIVVLGPGWAPTIPLLQLFAIAIPFRYLLNMQSAWMDALGALRPRTATLGVCLALKLGGMFLVLAHGGDLVELLVAIVAVDVIWQAIYVVLLPLVSAAPRRMLLTAYLAFALTAAIVAGCEYTFTRVAHAAGWSAVTTLAGQVSLGGVLVVIAILVAVRTRLLGIRPEVFAGLPFVGRWLARSAR
jgi:lipopolysaccharide exporter